MILAIFSQKGAEKEDVEQLSKYVFRCCGCTENSTDEIQGTYVGFMTLCGGDTPTDERLLTADNAVCSLAFLSSYLIFTLKTVICFRLISVHIS